MKQFHSGRDRQQSVTDDAHVTCVFGGNKTGQNSCSLSGDDAGQRLWGSVPISDLRYPWDSRGYLSEDRSFNSLHEMARKCLDQPLKLLTAMTSIILKCME